MSDVLPFIEDSTPTVSTTTASAKAYVASGASQSSTSSTMPSVNSSSTTNTTTINTGNSSLRSIVDSLKVGDNTSSTKVEDNSTNNRDDKSSSGNNAITSLTLEQVNDDADELIELRGEGRYFGVIDPKSGDSINQAHALGPLCGNCHKRGHIRSKCKTVVCHKCGVVGDHYETHCPTTLICSRCNEKGHMAISCTNKNKKRQYCSTCDTFNHSSDTCPTIWRSYIVVKSATSNDKELDQSNLPNLFCYNCGSNEHYGDDCNEYRTSRVPNFGSAFSGSNLPKNLRSAYFNSLSKSKRTKYLSGYRNFQSQPNQMQSSFGRPQFGSPSPIPSLSTQLPPRKSIPTGPSGSNNVTGELDNFVKSLESHDNRNNNRNRNNNSNNYNNNNNNGINNHNNNNNNNNNRKRSSNSPNFDNLMKKKTVRNHDIMSPAVNNAVDHFFPSAATAVNNLRGKNNYNNNNNNNYNNNNNNYYNNNNENNGPSRSGVLFKNKNNQNDYRNNGPTRSGVINKNTSSSAGISKPSRSGLIDNRSNKAKNNNNNNNNNRPKMLRY
ncbi:uncharacterized protein RJT21DRAFT_121210 [Scheffersomyces amazonensis]|uniref:uncharacterized protein n=1 Tax=Scheffersomyces amazonensis TaxID=1078765 RepID=UPI00315CDDB5